jgi:hypothetical protein
VNEFTVCHPKPAKARFPCAVKSGATVRFNAALAGRHGFQPVGVVAQCLPLIHMLRDKTRTGEGALTDWEVTHEQSINTTTECHCLFH